MITVDEFGTNSPREAAARLIQAISGNCTEAQMARMAEGNPYTGAARAVLAYTRDGGETADPALRDALVAYFRRLLGMPSPIPVNPTIETANDSLSRLVSEIAREMRCFGNASDDLRAFGAPSECGGLVLKGTRRRLTEILAKYNQTPDSFYSLLANRTSARFVYVSGLDIRQLFD